jgi:hypothetical protein
MFQVIYVWFFDDMVDFVFVMNRVAAPEMCIRKTGGIMKKKKKKKKPRAHCTQT